MNVSLPWRFMSESPREKARRRAKQLKRLVEDLDAVRAMRLFNVTDTLRLIRVLGLEDEVWQKVSEALTNISTILIKHPRFPRIKKVDSFSTYLFVFSFIASLVSLVLLLLNIELFLAYIVLLISLVILNISYLTKLYVSVSVHRVYLENSKEIEKYSELFKKAVENGLAKLRGELRKAGIEPTGIEFKLYYNDYSPLVEVKSKGRIHVLKFR